MHQTWIVNKAQQELDGAVQLSQSCLKGERMCWAARSTYRNVQDDLRVLLPPLKLWLIDLPALSKLETELLPAVLPLAQAEEGSSKAERAALDTLRDRMHATAERREKSARSSLAEAEAEYSRLATPKLLYRCGEEVTLLAGTGLANYNALYEKAKADCGQGGGELVILKSES
jgi:hypothetical protein